MLRAFFFSPIGAIIAGLGLLLLTLSIPSSVTGDDEQGTLPSARTPRGSWQVREELTIDFSGQRTISLSKISRVEDAIFEGEPHVWIEIERKLFSLSDDGRRGDEKKTIVFKVLLDEVGFNDNFLTIESNPIRNAKKIILKSGREDPVYIDRFNMGSFLALVGDFPSYSYRDDGQEIVVVPDGRFNCVRYISDSIPDEGSETSRQPLIESASSIWVQHIVPFGVVKRISRDRRADGRTRYQEVQLLEYGSEGAFPRIRKVRKNSPFRSLEDIMHNSDGN